MVHLIQRSYILCLPSNQEHSSHPTALDIKHFSESAPLLIAKISEMVLSNICDI